MRMFGIPKLRLIGSAVLQGDAAQLYIAIVFVHGKIYPVTIVQSNGNDGMNRLLWVVGTDGNMYAV